MRYTPIYLVLSIATSGCATTFENTADCYPPTGDVRSDADDPGTTGFSANEVIAVVDGLTWPVTFQPSYRVDDPTPFTMDITVHVSPDGDADEWDVAESTSANSWKTCEAGRHLRVPITLSITTPAGDFAGQPKGGITQWIDAMSLDLHDIRMQAAIYPDESPLSAAANVCWSGADPAQLQLGLSLDGTMAEPWLYVGAPDPVGVQCFDTWLGHVEPATVVTGS